MDSDAEERSKLQMCNHVAATVKELQRESAAVGEGTPLRSGPNVQRLCGAIELVLRHGLASSWRNGFSSSPSFFPVATRISRRDVTQEIKALTNCTTDHARARAWIRLAVNEQSLESYISSLGQDQEVLDIYYDPTAFMRDSEKMTMLLGLLAGMSFTMNFDVPIDDPSVAYEPTPIASYADTSPDGAANSSSSQQFPSAKIDGMRITSEDLPAEAPEDLMMEPIRKGRKKKKKKRAGGGSKVSLTSPGSGDISGDTNDKVNVGPDISAGSPTANTPVESPTASPLLSRKDEADKSTVSPLVPVSNAALAGIFDETIPSLKSTETSHTVQVNNTDAQFSAQARIDQNTDDGVDMSTTHVAVNEPTIDNIAAAPAPGTAPESSSSNEIADVTPLVLSHKRSQSDVGTVPAAPSEVVVASPAHSEVPPTQAGHQRSMSDGSTVNPLADLLARRAELGLQPVLHETGNDSMHNDGAGTALDVNPSASEVVKEEEERSIPTFDISRMEEMLKLLDDDGPYDDPAADDDDTFDDPAIVEPNFSSSVPDPKSIADLSSLPTQSTTPDIIPDSLVHDNAAQSLAPNGQVDHVLPTSEIVDPSPMRSWSNASSLIESPVNSDAQHDEPPPAADDEYTVVSWNGTVVPARISDEPWDTGPMTLSECKDILTRSARGDFLVCLDLEAAQQENVDELRWLVISDGSGVVESFPIRKVNSTSYEFMNQSFPGIDEIINQAKRSTLYLTNSTSGMPLIVSTAAHDEREWYQSTSFSDPDAVVSLKQDLSAVDAGVNAWVAAARQTPPLEDILNARDGLKAALAGTMTPVGPPRVDRLTPVLVESDRADSGGPDEFVVISERKDNRKDGSDPAITFRAAAAEDDSIDDLLHEINVRVDVVRNAAQQNSHDAVQNPETEVAMKELVDLRYRYQLAKEALNADVGTTPVEQFGGALIEHNQHRFTVHPAYPNPEMCDHCNLPIKTKLMHNPLKGIKPRAYRCVQCKYTIHRKCLPHTKRTCLVNQVLSSGLETRICPNQGLDAQLYKCCECSSEIGFQGMFAEARLCDYSGQYMCPECHKKDTTIIPARVIHNWDFSQYEVSQRSKETLAILHERPIIDMQATNPLLMNHVEEIMEFSRKRRLIKMMLKFLTVCRFAAQEPKLLSRLEDRPYLFKTENIYSMRDLIELKNGTLLTEADATCDACERHIRSDCQLCYAKGSFCELCNSKRIIFPFDIGAFTCKKCHLTMHKSCLDNADGCPRCARIAMRKNTGPSVYPETALDAEESQA